MIFVTVGTQLPFDRLVKAVDGWAAACSTASDDTASGDTASGDTSPGGAAAFAQIGETEYRPSHMEWVEYLPSLQFKARLAAASVIVSHAGIGSLLTSLQARKPMLVMPRRAALNEIRNDHQLATVKWLRQLPGITVCDDTDELAAALQRRDWQTPDAVRNEASPELLSAIRDFITRA